MYDNIVIPYVKLHPHKISLYNSYEYCNKKFDYSEKGKNDFDIDENSLDNNPYFEKVNLNYYGIKGFVSQDEISLRTQKKIENAINWLLYITDDKSATSAKNGKKFQFKIAFITLTLSSVQQHSDYFIKENMLAQFIRELKIYYEIKHYLWRAETQKNDNIHFHIIVDKFIPHDWIKKTWNRIQNKYNYVDIYSKNQQEKYKNGFLFDENDKYKRTHKEQIKTFLKGKKILWTQPNSTDIHSVQKIKNIAAYLAKYCTKNPENGVFAEKLENENRYYDKTDENSERLIEGQMWNLSATLSKFKGCRIMLDWDYQAEIQILQNLFPSKVKYYDYCTVMYITFEDLEKHKMTNLLFELREYIKNNSS